MDKSLTKAEEIKRRELARRSAERVRLHRRLHRDRPQARDVDRAIVTSLFAVIASEASSGIDPAIMRFMKSVRSHALDKLGGGEEAAYVLRVRLDGVARETRKPVSP
jgi:hypothetical protein